MQAQHNIKFHRSIDRQFADQFFDWKVTVLFYVALHLLKALAEKRGIHIGETHYDIENACNPDRNSACMRISRNAWREYRPLFSYSRKARYEGVADMATYEALRQRDHGCCLVHLKNFKKYIAGQGLVLEGIEL